MSIKTKEQAEDPASETSPIRIVLILLFWVIFSIIGVGLLVKLCEIYADRFGQDSLFYLLILLFSIGLVPILYKKVSNIFSGDQNVQLARYFQDELRLGCFLESADEYDGFIGEVLDLELIMNKENLSRDKELTKEDRKIWLKEENEIFKV